MAKMKPRKSTRRNPNVIYGTVELPEGFEDPRNAKIRISIMIEGDLLDGYKDAARLTPHGQYQTLMKQVLRQGLERLPKAKDGDARSPDTKLTRRQAKDLSEILEQIQAVSKKAEGLHEVLDTVKHKKPA
jgi:hypothetical protein